MRKRAPWEEGERFFGLRFHFFEDSDMDDHIFLTILENVTDVKTFIALSRVSRGLKEICMDFERTHNPWLAFYSTTFGVKAEELELLAPAL